MSIDWLDIRYLNRGTERQQQAFRCLSSLNILEDLSAYSPLLAGTIPIDIDIEESDLDILCEVPDLMRFTDRLEQLYRHYEGFEIGQTILQDKSDAAVCGFVYDGFCIEIFGQNRPVMKQNGYLHMAVEHRLLAMTDPGTKEHIRRLKRLGLKTEPAFAHYFRIEGDPYAELLLLEPLSDQELKEKLSL
ncbi:DUF4269 domain-containing protein [Paenibacillus kobensis]|uniref:DUF4269 domain-containing protein n=1 Tax=Paenibacillus kobensis TaxID=59841 RepID=UPI000FDA31A1|nr:DUF4269 domain-containing protein [Paenibacillus kobensis]